MSADISIVVEAGVLVAHIHQTAENPRRNCDYRADISFQVNGFSISGTTDHATGLSGCTPSRASVSRDVTTLPSSPDVRRSYSLPRGASFVGNVNDLGHLRLDLTWGDFPIDLTYGIELTRDGGWKGPIPPPSGDTPSPPKQVAK